MKIMVTGAAGFIGRRVVNWLSLNSDPSDQFFLVDELTKFLLVPRSVSNVRNFVCLSPEQGLGKVGLMDGGVIHLGARSSTRDADVDALVRGNYLYSKDLIDQAVQHSVPAVIVTSAGVYGNGLCRHDLRSFEPLTAYAASKSMVDSYALLARSAHIVVARPFNVYGPGEVSKPVDSQSFLYRAAWAVARGDAMSFHSPDVARDYVYVGDVAIALQNLLKFARMPTADRRAFDIGSCRPAPVREVVEHAASVSGGVSRFTNLNGPNTIADPTYQRSTQACWDESYPFDSGVFMDWRKGFDMLVEQIKLGVQE